MRFTALLLLLFLMSSCSQEYDFKTNFEDNCIDDNPEFMPDTPDDARELKFVFHENATLEITEEDNGSEDGWITVEVIKGENLVFEYYYEKKDKEMIADDEFTESLYFEIPTDLDSFLIDTEHLEEANAVYGIFCFCINAGFHRMPSGCIKGEKISESEWLIELILQKEFEYHSFNKMLSEVFAKSEE